MTERLSKKKVYLFYLMYFFIIPIGFFLRVIYSRTISVEELGLLYSMISFFGFISVFTNLGLSTSLRFFIPKFIVKKKTKSIINVFYFSLGIQLVLVSIFSILIFLFSEFLAINYFHNSVAKIMLRFFLIFFICSNFFTSILDVFISYGLDFFYLLGGFIQNISILILTVLFWFLGVGDLFLFYVSAWSIATIVSLVFYSVILLLKCPYLISKPKWDKTLLKEHLSYSFSLFFSNIGFNIMTQIDIIMITFFIGLSGVGLYSNSFSLVSTFISIFTSIGILFMPLFSEKKEQKDLSGLQKIVNFIYTTIVFLLLPFSLVLIIYSKLALKLIFGSSYSSGNTILVIFSFFLLVKVMMTYNLNIMNGLGLAKKTPKIVLIAVICNIILNLVLINLIGIIGVVISTIFSWMLVAYLTYVEVSNEIDYKFPLKFIPKVFFSGFCFLVFLFIFKNLLINLNIYFSIIFTLGMSYLLYILIGIWIKIVTMKELYDLLPDPLKQSMLKVYGYYKSL